MPNFFIFFLLFRLIYRLLAPFATLPPQKSPNWCKELELDDVFADLFLHTLVALAFRELL